MANKPNPADYSPELNGYSGIGKFKAWVQMVLPQVYDDALSYQELVYKMLFYINTLIDDVDSAENNVSNLKIAYDNLQTYINEWFAGLDVQEEVNEKLDQYVSDGTLSALIQPLFDAYKTYIDNTVTTQNADIAVLKSRMDTFASLQNGSTTGDAELADIRVAYNGNTYSTAGDSVRAQIIGVTDMVYPLFETKIPRRNFFAGFRINPTNNTSWQSNDNYLSAGGIVFKYPAIIKVGSGVSGVCRIYETASLSSYVGLAKANSDNTIFYIPANTRFVFSAFVSENPDYTEIYNSHTLLLTQEDYNNLVTPLTIAKNSGTLRDALNQLTPVNYALNTLGFRYSTTVNSGMYINKELMFTSETDFVIAQNTTRTNYITYTDDYTTVAFNTFEHVTIPANKPFILSVRVSVSDITPLITACAYQSTANISYPTSTENPCTFNLDQNKCYITEIEKAPTGFTIGNTQGSDVYGDYQIITKSTGLISIKQISTNSIVASNSIPTEDIGHANSAAFCNQFYADTDPMPLFLVADWYLKIIHVLRVDSTLTVSKINDITFETPALGSVDVLYDRFNNCLYSVGWKEISGETRTGLIVCGYNRAFNFIADSAITSADYCFNPFFVPMSRILQGGCAHKGLLFLGTSDSSYINTEILVIDVGKRCIIDNLTKMVSRLKNTEIEDLFVMQPDNTYKNTVSIGIITQEGATYAITQGGIDFGY